MANTRQAKKRVRQAERHRVRNQAARSTIRTAIRQVREALTGGNLEGSRGAYQKTTSLVDRAVGKGLIHRNQAARIKSRLNRHLKKLSAHPA
ncbi:MAG: 30S ribosomal protein S20 [Gammaproteobacteria bacterium]